MGFLVNSLFSVGRREDLNWYLYVIEPAAPFPSKAGQWLKDHFAEIAESLGTSAALVKGFSPKISEEIYAFLEKYLNLSVTGAWADAGRGRGDVYSLIVTDRPLPHTEAMAMLRLCALGDPADVLEKRMNEIVAAIQDGTMKKLIETGDSIQIQAGDFNLKTTDCGIRLLRRANEILSLKIPLGIADVDVSKAISLFLDRHYPRIGG